MAQWLWTQKQDTGPTARYGTAMAFDSIRNRTVLFGGNDGTNDQNDTWEWDGENWTQFAHLGPPPRSGHAMAFDSNRGKIVLFGGGTGKDYFNDTWEWDGEVWTQVADSGPIARDGHALAYDSKRKRVVLFGGDNSYRINGSAVSVYTPPAVSPHAGFGAFGDTWVWDGSNWTQEQEPGPAARFGHAMSYDSVRDRIAMFGGTLLTWADEAPTNDGSIREVTFANTLNDTWEYDGLLWKQVASTGPEARFGSAMVFNGTSFLLFGGSDGLMERIPIFFRNTWQWDGEHWTQRQDMGPAARTFAGLTFDSDRQRGVIFGGCFTTKAPPNENNINANYNYFGDTWEQFEQAMVTNQSSIAPKIIAPQLPVTAPQTANAKKLNNKKSRSFPRHKAVVSPAATQAKKTIR